MATPGNTRAIQVLSEAGVDFEVHTYDMDTLDDTVSYGEAVADQLGVEPARLFKTLVAEAEDGPVVAIVPVQGRLALKTLARHAGGKKASLIDPADAERLTGYVTGGISPFGQRRRLPVYLDASAVSFDTIYVSGGQRGIQLEVSPTTLVDLLDAELVEELGT